MTQAAPIVESREGELSFLLGSGGPSDLLRVRWREAPFPDVANLITVLEAHRRALDGEMEQYGHGRAANSLAAAYICTGQLEKAWEALNEAESEFVAMIGNSPGPQAATLLGLAVVKYNACVLLRQAGEQGRNSVLAEQNREFALEALARVPETNDNHGYRFVAAALSVLGS